MCIIGDKGEDDDERESMGLDDETYYKDNLCYASRCFFYTVYYVLRDAYLINQ